MMCNSGKP